MDTKKLRQKILDLAIHGKLVPQDPNDEPASVLLERIRAEKEKLIKEGKIKAPKKSKSAGDTSHYPKDVPFEVPEGWVWTTLGTISSYGVCQSVQVERINDDAWVLELEDIEKDTGKLLSVKTKRERVAHGTRHSFQSGQVLYSKLRTYLNKVLLAEHDGFCSTEIMPITFYGGISSEYMVIVLSSPYFLNYTDSCGYGVKMPRLGTNDATKAAIPVPPLEEQRIIVQQVKQWLCSIEDISRIEEDLCVVINKARIRILDLAIRGKLVPQDPSEEPAIEYLKRVKPNFESSHNLHYDVTPVNGWVLVEFKEVFDSISSKPYQIAMSEIKDIGRFPVISQGSKIIDGYSDNVERVFKTGVPVYVFGDHTKVLKYVPHDFIVGADGVKILKPRWDSKYLFYHLLYCVSNMENRGYSRNYQYLSSSVLHIPPIAEQNRIVSAIEMLFKELDSISIVTTK